MAKKGIYHFKINKELLPKDGRRINWAKVNELEVYSEELECNYILKVNEIKRNKRSETFILLSYNNMIASEYVRTNSISDGKLEKYFTEFGIIKKEIQHISNIKKVCNVCKNLKNITEFEKNKSCSDGHTGICKICRKERRTKYKKICLTCNKLFENINKNAKYCSTKCKPQHIEKKITVSCSICGSEKKITKYRKKNHNDFYCSDECKNKGYSLKYSGKNSARYDKLTAKCAICGIDVTRNRYEIEINKYNYCSKECANKGWSKFYSKENNPLYGIERPEIRGENNPNWNPNKTREQRQKDRKILENTQWVKSVLERGDYTCKCCGKRGGDIVAHHLDGYNWCIDKRFNVNNGVVLCDKCHKLFHRKYGYGNNTKEQFNTFKKHMLIYK